MRFARTPTNVFVSMVGQAKIAQNVSYSPIAQEYVAHHMGVFVKIKQAVGFVKLETILRVLRTTYQVHVILNLYN